MAKKVYRLEEHHSLKRARGVLRLVQANGVGKWASENVCIKSFANFREQGLALVASLVAPGWNQRRAVFFAEHRKSDDVVVYVDHTPGVEPSLSEEGWERGTYFARGRERQAAAFILAVLLGWENEVKAKEKAARGQPRPPAPPRRGPGIPGFGASAQEAT